jgi:hypothetical protein
MSGTQRTRQCDRHTLGPAHVWVAGAATGAPGVALEAAAAAAALLRRWLTASSAAALASEFARAWRSASTRPLTTQVPATEHGLVALGKPRPNLQHGPLRSPSRVARASSTAFGIDSSDLERQTKRLECISR